MSATATAPARERPGSNSRPGFSAAKVTVRSAPHGPVVGRAGEAVDAGRDVAGEHRRAAGVGRAVAAAEPGAVGGVDHEVGGGQRAPGASAASTTATRTPRRRRRSAAARPSAPLLPLPATTTTRRP